MVNCQRVMEKTPKCNVFSIEVGHQIRQISGSDPSLSAPNRPITGRYIWPRGPPSMLAIWFFDIPIGNLSQWFIDGNWYKSPCVNYILIGDIPICSGFPDKLVLLYPSFCLVIFSHVLLVISKRLVIPRSFGGANPSNHGTKFALRGLLAFLLAWVILTSVGSFLISTFSPRFRWKTTLQNRSTSWCGSLSFHSRSKVLPDTDVAPGKFHLTMNWTAGLTRKNTSYLTYSKAAIAMETGRS